MKKKLFIPIILLCFALLVSCTGTAPETSSAETDPEAQLDELYGDNTGIAGIEAKKRDSVFTLNYIPSRSMNPITGECAENAMLEALIYEPLFTLNENFEPENVLCSSYSTADGKTYEFEIIPGVRFSDGEELSPSDVQYTIDYARDIDRYSQRLSNIEETAVEDNKFIVTLKNVDYSFVSLLDIPIISEGSIDLPYPAGTGRYVYTKEENVTRLTRNPYFRDQDSYPVDTIYLTGFSAATLNESFVDGSVDLVWIDPCDSSSVVLGGNHDERTMNTTILQYVSFNYDSVILSDKNVRNAIACTVDRSLAVREMSGFGLKATMLFSPLCSFFDNSIEHEDLSDSAFAASEYLKKAGMKDFDHDGWLDWPDPSTESGYYCLVEFNLIVNDDSREKKMLANDMAEILNGIGLKTTVTELFWDDYITAVEEGNFHICLNEVKLPANFDFTDILSTDGRLNYGFLSDGKLDELLSTFRSTQGTEPHDTATELAKYVQDNAFIVPILYRQYAIHTQRNTIYGIVTSPSSLFYNFADWTFTLN